MVLLPTWDFIITLVFVLGVVMALLLGRERIAVVTIASYVGLAVAGELGDALFQFMTGSNLIAGSLSVTTNMSVFLVKTIVFCLVLIFIVARGEFTSSPEVPSRGLGAMIITGFYGFLLAGLLVSSFVFFLAEDSRASLYSASPLVSQVMDYRIWWLLLPLVVMVGASIVRNRRQG